MKELEIKTIREIDKIIDYYNQVLTEKQILSNTEINPVSYLINKNNEIKCITDWAINHMNPDEISSLEITFKINEQIHDGYCSEAELYEDVSERHETLKISIPDSITISLFMNDYLINSSYVSALFLPIYKDNGCGYCGACSIYRVMDIKLCL
jgi:hypothetical protein